MVSFAQQSPRRDLGRLFSRILCALFGIVGAIPLLAGFLVRSVPVQEWAAAETARLLSEELGVEASYDVALELVPFRLSISDLVVPASDGKGPFLRAERIEVTPRVFSLLAGQLDAGSIEIERPLLRPVVKDGKLANLKYRLRQRSDTGKPLERAPFASLAMTEAKLDLSWDERRLSSPMLDIDVLAEPGMSFEVAIRLANGTLLTRRKHAAPDTSTGPREALDEDAICRVDLRLSHHPGELTLRRLSLLAVVDDDEKPGNRPSCDPKSVDNNPNRVAARLSSLRMEFRGDELTSADGHVVLRLPAGLANRAIQDLPFEGWVSFSGQLNHDARFRLPQLSGRAEAGGLKLDGIVLANELKANLQLSADVIRVPELTLDYGGADVRVSGVRIAPFEAGAPLSTESVEVRDMPFPGLMRDLDVTNDTIVRWDLERVLVSEISGTLAPFELETKFVAETSNFEVTHGAYHDPRRKHMIGVDSARVRGRFHVDAEAFRIVDTRADFGKSSVFVKLVSIGFENQLDLVVPKGSHIDLADISPLAAIPIAGSAQLEAEMHGVADDVLLTGNISIAGFEFGGFPLGDIQSARVRFVPLKVDLEDVQAKKGRSPIRVSSARIDFDTAADVKLDALVESPALDLRDFLAMWNFGTDPRWTHLQGHGKTSARVHYVLGGPRDRCGGGNLRVVGASSLDEFEAFEERYHSGAADFDFHWSDFAAGYRGISLDVPSFSLEKGTGTLAGSFVMRPGAKISGNLLGTGIPIAEIDALGERVNAVEGRATTVVGKLSGTLDALEVTASAGLSEIRLGSHTLPASDFSVRLEPRPRPLESLGTTQCGQTIPGEFDRARWERDEVEGTFFVSGQLFGGQAKFQDLALTAQRSKVWRGAVALNDFDMAAALQLFVPGSATNFSGSLSGRVDITSYPMKDPARSDLRLSLDEFQASQAGFEAKLVSENSALELGNRQLDLEDLALAITAPGGQSGVFDVRGSLENVGRDPRVDATLELRPTDLSAFVTLIPKAERAKGRVDGRLSVQGPLANPNVRGGLQLADGEVELEDLKTPITDLNVQVLVDPTQVRVSEGTARIGAGRLSLKGRAPLRGTSLGTARADLEIRGLSLALEDGIRVTLDSNLRAVYEPTEPGAPAPLPKVDGNVTVTSFDYTRRMSMTADLATFTKRGQRTEVESYDPEKDAVEFDVQLRSLRPLRLENELLETDLVVDSSGLRLKGTNQRFGMLGRLKLKPGGHIKLRNNDFEIRQGWVRFDDLGRIAPQVDVTAVTEFRRFEDSTAADAPGAGSVSTSSSSSMGGQWRINLHAHGDPENLKIDLTSTPTLPQDDIFLLLTVGLTRAELDQSRSAAVGSSVALEALGTLSGADRAVQDAVPVIDKASMGSAYNPKSGRTEPTITIGKRLAEKIRAQVTTGLSDSSKVESSLRWQMNPQVSVEGSYGNVNDISSSSLGNLGADIRWRLEFD